MPEIDAVTVHTLVEDSDLVGIWTTRLCAERIGDDPTVDIEPSHTLSIDMQDDGKGFRVRIATILATAAGNIECDVAAAYSLASLDSRELPQGALQEFVNNVAVMTLLPFVRQGIADLSLRVFETALIMPIVQRGQLAFELTKPA